MKIGNIYIYIVLKPRDTLLSCFHTIVVITIPHSFEKNESSLKHNLNSSTRPVSVRKLRKFPGVFKQVCKYTTMRQRKCNILSCAAVDQRKCNILSYTQNCKQYQAMQLFSLAFIAQREISVYNLWSCMPVLHSQQTMLWRNEVLQRSAIFLTKHPLQPKSCCYLQAGGCFWASQMLFSGRNMFVKVEFLKNNMCYLQCVLCSKVQYSCLSFIMVTFLQADAVFSKDWIFNLKLQSYLNKFKQNSLKNRNNIVSKYALCPLKM